MRATLVLVAILVIPALQGCSSTYGSMLARPSPNQQSTYQDGLRSILSVKNNIVAVVPAQVVVDDDDNYLYFIVDFKNQTSHPITFSTENVKVTYTDDGGDVGSLHVYSYPEMVRDELDNEKSSARWAAISGALAAAAASYSTTTTNFSGQAYTNSGESAYISGSQTSSTYNPSGAIAASNRTQAQLDRIHAQSQRDLHALSTGALKKQTVLSGTWYGGVVTMESPGVQSPPTPINITVNVDGKTYHFKFLLKETND